MGHAGFIDVFINHVNTADSFPFGEEFNNLVQCDSFEKVHRRSTPYFFICCQENAGIQLDGNQWSQQVLVTFTRNTMLH
jgi:hypothetical protein